jgi:hypothetical protein
MSIGTESLGVSLCLMRRGKYIGGSKIGQRNEKRVRARIIHDDSSTPRIPWENKRGESPARGVQGG